MINQRSSFETRGVEIYYEIMAGKDASAPTLIWAHGWGQHPSSFAHIYKSPLWRGTHLMIEFPGFGQSSPPPTAWSSKDYANAIEALLRHLNFSTPRIWIGHSFGCRVGICLAAQAPDLVQGLCLISAPGIPYKRPLKKQLRLKLIRLWIRLIKQLPLPEKFKNQVKDRFGSADYKAAGILRPTFVKVVSEDLSAEARAISQETLIIVGEQDADTPPAQAKVLAKLIPNSHLHILKAQDHYLILSTGAQRVIDLLHSFIKKAPWTPSA